MNGQAVFEQVVAFVGKKDRVNNAVNEEDYEQWKRDFIWEALHGQRYGQSFCNRFSITDHNLYYAPGDVEWCDRYIKENYLA